MVGLKMNKRGSKQAPFFYFFLFFKRGTKKVYYIRINEKQAIADPRVE